MFEVTVSIILFLVAVLAAGAAGYIRGRLDGYRHGVADGKWHVIKGDPWHR